MHQLQKLYFVGLECDRWECLKSKETCGIWKWKEIWKKNGERWKLSYFMESSNKLVNSQNVMRNVNYKKWIHQRRRNNGNMVYFNKIGWYHRRAKRDKIRYKRVG